MSSGLKEKCEPIMGEDREGEGVKGKWGVGVMDRAGDRVGASRPPGPGSGETGNGDRGSGWTLGAGLGRPAGVGPPP